MKKIIFILPIALVALFLSSCDYKPLSVNQPMDFVKVSPEGMTPFLIGKYEVSQREWRSVMGTNPSYHQYGDDYPVENVSYEDVQAFLEKLNKKTGNEYRLPTREEWMAAARSANREFYAYSGCNTDNVTKDGKLIENDTILRAYAVYKDNSRNVRGEYVTAKRGTKEPNTIGLHDMSGNVSEMTCDIIPEGDGVYVKGGSCYSSKDALKIDAESQLLLGAKGIRCGFRLVRALEGTGDNVEEPTIDPNPDVTPGEDADFGITVNVVPEEPNPYNEDLVANVDFKENQRACKVSQEGNVYTVRGDLSAMQTYASSDPSQGKHKWVALYITTDVKNNMITEESTKEAENLGFINGRTFIYWMKADEVINNPRTFSIVPAEGTNTTVDITFKFENTAKEIAVNGVEVVSSSVSSSVPGYETEFATNQNAVDIVKEGNVYTVRGALSAMQAYKSSDPSQGEYEYKWVAIAVKTDVENEYSLIPAEKANAEAMGYSEGKTFIYWMKADEVVNASKTFTLSGSDKKPIDITFKFEDTTPKIAVVSSSVSSSVPGYETEFATNQNAVTIVKEGNVWTVEGDLSAMQTYASSDPSQGPHKWVAIAVTTDVENEFSSDPAEKANAEAMGYSDGKTFIYWMKADEVVNAPRTFAFKAGKDLVIKFRFNDLSL